MTEEFLYQDQDDNKGGSSLPFYVIILLLSIMFTPSIIIGGVFYLFFFKLLKWKPHVTLPFVIFFGLISFKFILGIDLNNSETYLKSYLSISSLIGILLGYTLIIFHSTRIKKEPALTSLPGWLFKFKFNKSPYQIIKRKYLINKCKTGKDNHSYDYAPLGVLIDEIITNDKSIESEEIVKRYYEESVKHTLITGASGSGKSIEMLNLIYNDILAGYPTVIIDNKKTPEYAYLLSKWAYENNRVFYHFKTGEKGTYVNKFCDEQASYDPLATGTRSSKVDVILGMREWDTASDVYKNENKSALQTIFYILDKVDRNELPKIPWEEGGIAQFLSALEPPNLFDMIQVYEKSLNTMILSQSDEHKRKSLKEFYEELTKTKDNETKRQIENIKKTLKILTFSSYSDWLAKGNTPYHIDLEKILLDDNGPVVLFQFDPNEEKETSKDIGNIVLSDIARVIGSKSKKNIDLIANVYIDEFATLNQQSIESIVAKSRAANICITLSTQSLEQITKEVGEAYLNSLLESMNNFIVHSGSKADIAEKFSNIIGKKDKLEFKQTGKRKSGFFSMNLFRSRNSYVNYSIKEDWKVSPKDFQSLQAPIIENNFESSAYYITKTCSEKKYAGLSQVIARKFRPLPNQEVIQEIPKEFIKKMFPPEDLNKKPKMKPIEQIDDKDILEDVNFKIEEIEEEILTPYERYVKDLKKDI